MRWDRLLGGVALLATAGMLLVVLLSDDSVGPSAVDVSVESTVGSGETGAVASGVETSAQTPAPAVTDPTAVGAPPSSESEPSTSDTGVQPPTTAAPVTTSPTALSTAPATIPILLSPGDISVRVINAGAVRGAATAVTDRLETSGFDTESPGDLGAVPFTYLLVRSSDDIPAGWLVADALSIDRTMVVAHTDQPEWQSARPSTDVLVLLGAGFR